ncbi:MAG: glutamate racemase, partial [Candidatus Limnocylindrales bacterium]
GCTHYPLLGPIIARVAGESVAIIDSASATASALASLLEVNGLQAPEGAAAQHRQLTTGDVTAFRRTARRLFGELFPSVEAVRLPGAA